MTVVSNFFPEDTGRGKMCLDPCSGIVVHSSDLIIGRLQWELFQEVTPRGRVPRNVKPDHKFTSLNHDLPRCYLKRCADGNVGVQEYA